LEALGIWRAHPVRNGTSFGMRAFDSLCFRQFGEMAESGLWHSPSTRQT